MLSRYVITPRSPIITPLMSDTFFGHFCWYLAYQHNDTENYLSDFLEQFHCNQPAPVIFSCGFPKGFLPRPTIPGMKASETDQFIQKHLSEFKKNQISPDISDQKAMFDSRVIIKQWKKRQWISLDQWSSINHNYSEFSLYEQYLTTNDSSQQKYTELDIVGANFVNRLTGMVPDRDFGGGGFFHREKIWFNHNSQVHLYVDINDNTCEQLVDQFLLEYLPDYGFGADKSVGMGHLGIKKDVKFDPQTIQVENANAQLSLSYASFEGIGNYRAHYKLFTKFGRLGGHYAIPEASGKKPNPFKKPVLMFEPGAVFYDVDPRELIRQPLLKDIHSNKAIRHSGIPLLMPFRIER